VRQMPSGGAGGDQPVSISGKKRRELGLSVGWASGATMTTRGVAKSGYREDGGR